MAKSNRPTKEGYDVPMIRDFLEHLMWEVRVLHAEATNLRNRTDPQLVEMVQKYQLGRNTLALLMAKACPPVIPVIIRSRAGPSSSSWVDT